MQQRQGTYTCSLLSISKIRIPTASNQSKEVRMQPNDTFCYNLDCPKPNMLEHNPLKHVIATTVIKSME